MYKTHIRDSVYRELRDRTKKQKFSQYLTSLSIENLRVFKHAQMTFDFPITALIGPNGSGKSTFLMSAGCAYKDVKPSDFFAKSQFDVALKDAAIRFSIIDKKTNPTQEIKGVASFKRAKWDRRNTTDRKIGYFGIRRTVPPTEQKELSVLKSKSIIPNTPVELSSEEIVQIRRILGFDNHYKHLTFPKSSMDLFLATSAEGASFSEFHFGAGESSVTRLVYDLEHYPDASLILIEEIENGLHPLAVLRLVEYLLDVSNRKKHQIIFTTHSNYAIQLLPEEAVWYCLNGTIQQGKVDIETLRVLVGEMNKQLVIFTEDAFAKTFITTVFRQFDKTHLLDLIEIHPVGGKNHVMDFVSSQTANPAITLSALGLLDGDVTEQEIARNKYPERFFQLPGLEPEKAVWDFITEDIDKHIVRITLKLTLGIHQQEFVKKVIADTDREVIDYHLLFAVLGEKLGFLDEMTVINAFISTYCEANNGKLYYLVTFVENELKLK